LFEVELTAWADPGIEGRLGALGAEPLGRERFDDLYFEHPSRSLEASDEKLRVRTVDGGAGVLTYKGPCTDGTREAKEEIETRVDDPAALTAALLRLGFTEACTKRKRCSHWRLDDAVVTVAEVEGLGLFVEVEIAVEREDEVGAARARLPPILDRLGIPRERIERRYYTEMLAEKGAARSARR
jgi:adenylate cyclase class 2